MSSRWWWVIMGLCCLLVSGCNSCSSNGEYVTKDKIDGYKGAAKMNPYLAAERFIQEICGEETIVRSGYVNYDGSLGMVIAPASTLHSDVVTDKMLDWVSDGGIYVCLLQRGEKTYDDIGEGCDHDTQYWIETESEPLQYLLDKFSIELMDEASGKTTGGKSYYELPNDPVVNGEELPLVENVEVNFGENKLSMKIGGTQEMKLSVPLGYNDVCDAVTWNSKGRKDKRHRFLGLQHGEGRVYFITDARAFRNPYLGMADHAQVLEMMLSENYGDIVFSFNKRRGFWALMHQHAGPALLGVFVLLVIWLWRHIPRFGPLVDVETSNTSSYRETLKNTGHFLWRQKRPDVLLEPLRLEIKKRSGFYDKEGGAKVSLIDNISKISGLSEEAVSEAMGRNEAIDGASMVRITKNLQTIIKAL